MKATQLAEMLTQPIEFSVLHRGKMPQRFHDNHDGIDVGLDCSVRAIVDLNKVSDNPRERFTITYITERYSISDDSYYTGHIGRRDGKTFWALGAGESVSIGLGFNVAIPPGMGGFLFPRSCASRAHLEVLNTNPIDPGFTGEVWLELKNGGHNNYEIRHGERLVQLVIKPVWVGKPKRVREIKGGLRGNGSHGSTGR